MIICITTWERNPRTGKDELIVSHGVDLDTDHAVTLPCQTPQSLGAVFDPELREFVLPTPQPLPKSHARL